MFFANFERLCFSEIQLEQNTNIVFLTPFYLRFVGMLLHYVHIDCLIFKKFDYIEEDRKDHNRENVAISIQKTSLQNDFIQFCYFISKKNKC